MQTFSDNPSGARPADGTPGRAQIHGRDTGGAPTVLGGGASAFLAGAAVTVAAVGAALTFTGLDSPLRGPCTLFLLLAAPAGALAVALRELEPLGRAVASTAGAAAVNLLLAQGMLALHVWSVRGGVAAVVAFSLVVLVAARARRPHHGHPARSRAR